MDPVEFRLKNHVGPEGQPGERTTPANEIIDTQPLEGGIPFSSNGLRECIERGAEAFGWNDYELFLGAASSGAGEWPYSSTVGAWRPLHRQNASRG